MVAVVTGFGVVAVAAGAGVLAATGHHGSAPREVYREAVVAQHRPLSLDPLFGREDSSVQDVGRLLYRRLLKLDDQASPRPDLAQSWGVSGDGLSYRFFLAAGLRWSDGQPLTADDVAATIAVVQRPDYPDPALAGTWRGVRVSVSAHDALSLDLPSPRASLPVAAAELPILPARIARLGTTELRRMAQQPLPTSGPVRIKTADSDVIILEPNPASPTRLAISEMQLRLVSTVGAGLDELAAGDVDGVMVSTPADRSRAAAIRGVHLHDILTFRFVDMIFNTRRPGLDDAVVRRAIAAAVDRAALITSALGGVGRVQVGGIPVAVRWMHIAESEAPDPALSARALEAAGWLPGDDGVREHNGRRLAFALAVPDVAPLPAVAGLLSRQLQLLGVQLRVAPVPPGTFVHDVIAAEAFDIAIADWDSGPDPDISTFWRSNAAPPTGFNASGLPPDPFLDRSLDSLATLSDPRLRQDAGREVDARLFEDAPAVFLYAPVVTFATSDALNGVAVPTVGGSEVRYAHLQWWRYG